MGLKSGRPAKSDEGDELGDALSKGGLAHGATHAHQLKESQAKTLSIGIIAMRQKNVNLVNT